MKFIIVQKVAYLINESGQHRLGPLPLAQHREQILELQGQRLQ